MTRRAVLGQARVARHRRIEAAVGRLGDAEVVRWLAASGLAERSHATAMLPGTTEPVFVKLLPLTDLELEPAHRGSTANVFGLPAYYHHRLGGHGHGAWREIETHRLANEWVLAGRCPHFVLLCGWRVLPIGANPREDEAAAYWGHDPAIARRAEEVAASTSSVVLFLEPFPFTLLEWLRQRADDVALVRETEATLFRLLSFMNEQGVLHMDAHFENVLTDGEELYLSDHGLAIARSFDLDPDEVDFYERHVANFDHCTAVTSLVHAVVTKDDARADWRQTLRERLAAGRARPIDEYVARRSPVALAIGEFYRRLRADLSTAYPAAELQRLLDG